MLEARSVDVAFRGVVALQGVTMTLAREEILGLIGPNGAGKTTLINVLSGFVAPDRGEVLLGGRVITRLAVHRRPALGLARTFQSVRLFARLTVAQNLEAAVLASGASGRRARATVNEMLERMDLLEHRDDPAAQLSHGIERRVGIARALATAPALLLLDEPAAGLDDVETRELGVLLKRIHDELNVGMLVVEHDMTLVMALCDRLHVLVDGRTLAVGTPREMRDDPAVRDAYLGIEEEHLVARG
ncbi:MAG TPA: ATP-binding cassette domain-containing protein [Solirubrobacteraceae bacterium]|jgi:branched-chain amino acid transport system ATP-binding protein